MSPATVDFTSEKKGHICPPSKATHPCNRWECLFVYAFICKFTNLRGRTDGLDSPMDFEEALLSTDPNPILTQVLARFVSNLRPLTRNLSSDQISHTVASVLAEFLKTPERTTFWNDDTRANADPFVSYEEAKGGLWRASWDFKLKVLRTLVELQLSHSSEIKKMIDAAWRVARAPPKKKDAAAGSESGPQLEDLQLLPIGQDLKRKRYWVVDDSPRVYTSTNPWKTSSVLEAICSSKVEYESIVAFLRAESPPDPGPGRKRPKSELAHLALIDALEARAVKIDTELARIARAKKKLQQRNLLIAQAELRETRTRQRTRPNYAYINDPGSGEDDGDEYRQEEDDDDLDAGYGRSRGLRRGAATEGTRRSTRTTSTSKANGKRAAPDDWAQWRGERRSTRLGAPDTTQDVAIVPEPKRAKTDESSVSAYSDGHSSKGTGPSKDSASALKPTEFVTEQVNGRKKSKFWYYAVEPAPAANGNSTNSQQPLHEQNGQLTYDTAVE